MGCLKFQVILNTKFAIEYILLQWYIIWHLYSWSLHFCNLNVCWYFVCIFKATDRRARFTALEKLRWKCVPRICVQTSCNSCTIFFPAHFCILTRMIHVESLSFSKLCIKCWKKEKPTILGTPNSEKTFIERWFSHIIWDLQEDETNFSINFECRRHHLLKYLCWWVDRLAFCTG